MQSETTRSLTVVHVADVHLDRPFVGSSADLARQRRRELREALRRCIAVAVERRADVLTIGGDLWEDEHVTPDTLRWVAAQFEALEFAVVIVAGNHDPLRPGGPYDRADFSPNVTVLGAGPALDRFDLGELTIWGMSWSQASSLRADVLDRFEVPADGREHLLLLHGTAGAHFEGGVHCPFTHAQVRRAGFRRCLAGHLHAASPEDSAVIYPGSPEPLAWSQDGRHTVAVLELDGSHAGRIDLIDVNHRRVKSIDLDCDNAQSSADVERWARERLREEEPLTGLMIRMTLRGRVARGCEVDAAAIEQALRSGGAVAAQVMDDTRVAFDLVAVSEGGGLRSEFVRLLDEALGPQATDVDREHVEFARELGLRALHGDRL